MGEKEKAKELVEKFYNSVISFLSDNMKLENAKRSALICVDENINILVKTYPRAEFEESFLAYWQNVKTEIENYEP